MHEPPSAPPPPSAHREGEAAARTEPVDPVVERLRSLTAAASTRRYPDTDNQMEEGVFSFAKREDEARVWNELLDVVTGGGRAPEHARALDAGCGLGAHAGPLAERFRDPLLLDADPGRARAAAARLGWGFGKRVFVSRVDDGSLLHPDLAAAFAFVQMVQVAGHLPLRAVATSLEAMRHLLAPGGHLLLAVPFTGGPRDLTFVTTVDGEGRVRPAPVDAAAYDALARAPVDGTLHVRHFCMTSLLSALAMAGLEVVDTRPYHWFSHDTGDIFALARRPA